MRTFRILFLSICIVIAAVGCAADLDQVNDRLDSLEDRIEALEELCKKMNTDITSLKALMDVLSENDYITAVIPIEEGGEIVGYTITFSKNSPITIYNGTDGDNGVSGGSGEVPQIGVKKDVDGIYYWTLDGAWLLDESGNKVPAQGKDGQDGGIGQAGQDGVTPQLKIENGMWYVSYNNGLSWIELGPAGTGEGGSSSGCIFSDVQQYDDCVYFILNDGSYIEIPKIQPFEIVFSAEQDIVCMPGQTVGIYYEVYGGGDDVFVYCIAQGDWQAEVWQETSYSGYVYVTAPVTGGFGKVLVLANNSMGQVAARTLTFEEGMLEAVSNTAYIQDGSSNIIEFELLTNYPSYEVYVSQGSDWVYYIPQTRALRYDYLYFQVDEYLSGPLREACIDIVYEEQIVESLYIVQQSAENYNTVIQFADPEVKNTLVQSQDPLIDINGDGEISYEEAEQCTRLPQFTNGFTVFEELRYFTSLTEIGEGTFVNCWTPSRILIPENIERIAPYAFNSCGNMILVFEAQVPPQVDADAFGDMSMIVIVPEGSEDAYMEIPELAPYVLQDVEFDMDAIVESSRSIIVDLYPYPDRVSYVYMLLETNAWEACGNDLSVYFEQQADMAGMTLHDFIMQCPTFKEEMGIYSHVEAEPGTSYVLAAAGCVFIGDEPRFFDTHAYEEVLTTPGEFSWIGTWRVESSQTLCWEDIGSGVYEPVLRDEVMTYDVTITEGSDGYLQMYGWGVDAQDWEVAMCQPNDDGSLSLFDGFRISLDGVEYVWLTISVNSDGVSLYTAGGMPVYVFQNDGNGYAEGTPQILLDSDDVEYTVLSCGIYQYESSTYTFYISRLKYPAGNITMTRISDYAAAPEFGLQGPVQVSSGTLSPGYPVSVPLTVR